jgi:hypothetical protein
MAGDSAVPTAVACRKHQAATDHPLTAVLIAIRQIDRERSTLGEHADELSVQRVALVPQGTFPIAGSTGRDIEIEDQRPERVELSARGVSRLSARRCLVLEGGSTVVRAGGAEVWAMSGWASRRALFSCLVVAVVVLLSGCD